MKGEAFYELFKEALHSFGLDWKDKKEMSVTIYEGEIMFFYYNQEYKTKHSLIVDINI